jgi:acyl carrier protein
MEHPCGAFHAGTARQKRPPASLLIIEQTKVGVAQMTTTHPLDAIILEALGLPPDTDVTTLSYAGTPEWDSVGHLELISSIEDRFGITVDAADVVEMVDYPALRRLLADKYAVEAEGQP